MKGINTWSFAPYTPIYDKSRYYAPYITRLAPFAGGFEADFINNTYPDWEHIVYYRKRGTEEWQCVRAAANVRIEGLEDNTDYELYLEDNRGNISSVRLVRTGEVPGTVINYLHPDDEEYAFAGRYLCSPSLLRLPSGRLLSSMDVYAGAAPQNLTIIFASDDNGKTWRYLTELFPCFWGKLFLCGNRLYMLGISTEYGDLLIGESCDEGSTWTMPAVLFRGSGNTREAGLHRAPMPVRRYDGKIYTDIQYGTWTKGFFCVGVLSADEDSDLLKPDSWTLSDFWNPLKETKPLPELKGAIEGNIIRTPEGRLIDFLRYSDGKALILSYDEKNPDKAPEYEELIDFPANASKFNIEYDEVSGKYIALVSYRTDMPVTDRNLLSMIWSENLKEWRIGRNLIDRSYMDKKEVGFQYVDFFIEGDDILYQCRTAYNKAHNFHDANYACFHVLKNFRQYLK